MPALRAKALCPFQGLGGVYAGEISHLQAQGHFGLIQIAAGLDHRDVAGEFGAAVVGFHHHRVEHTGGYLGEVVANLNSFRYIAHILGHPPFAVLHLGNGVLVFVVKDVAFVQFLHEDTAGDNLTAFFPVLDISGENHVDGFGLHDNRQGVFLAAFQGYFVLYLGKFLAVLQGNNGRHRSLLGREDEVVLGIIHLAGLHGAFGGRFVLRGLPAGIQRGFQPHIGQGKAGNDAVGVINQIGHHVGELVLEGNHHGLFAGLHIVLEAGDEVGRGEAGGLVGLDGKGSGNCAGIRMVGRYEGAALLGEPLEITGEFAAVVGEFLVVGVGVLGIADNAYTNGVTRFKAGGRDFGEDRGNAEGKGFLRRFRFVAGGQGQEAGDAVNKFFHKPYNLKLIS